SDTETAAADLQFKITDAPSHGTLSKGGTDLAAGNMFTGSPKDLLYTPNANFNGSDSFKFDVTDRGDPDNCGTTGSGCAAAKTDSKTVSLTVTPVNDAPSASSDDKTLAEDGSATIAVSGSDIETAAADLQFKITDAPSHGTLSRSGSDLATGDTFTGSPKDLHYTPNANFNGSDSF